MADEQATREVSRPTLGTVRRLSIAVARGPDAGRLIEPEAGKGASVGTAPDNDLVLGDPTVSRYHLELEPGRDGITVRDLGSLNGTFAGAVRLREGVVPRGAQLRVGDTVLVLDAADAVAPPAVAPPELPGMVFASAAMHEVARRVRMLADHLTTVLVQGETGTGKELVARNVHDLGSRKAGPFIVVDCASLPASLLEAELFGHEKGAFTGAERARAGAFERAHGGTVFLDEVGELPLLAQASLLGVLERRRFRRVGGDREIEVDVRVVSATNRDLRQEVNRGSFRADLYYRLAGARVVLPSLRERPEDIPLLVRHFAMELTGSEELPLSEETLVALAAQHWPGNVRELRSAVERAVAFGAAELAAMLDEPTSPRDSQPPGAAGDPPLERYRDAKARAIAAFERTYLAKLIERSGGNASEAARQARMDRPYLLALLRRYGLR
ncbi:MAG TPA: sigma 54-interacting transcriptional regulator [Labilithrix sp.]|nr:sigma 54-interacting transcriptional regulator [Labilithrix sp.]